MSKMAKLAGAMALAAGVGLAMPAMAQDSGVRGKQAGDFVVGLSAIGVLPENSGQGGRTDIGGRVRASNAATAQLDFTYFFTPYLAANLIAASTEHELTVKNTAIGNLNLGKIWALPPTLTLQVHPFPAARFSPYIGAGLNYTVFYGYNRGARTAALRDTAVSNTPGFALVAGIDYEVAPNWVVNLDFKKLFLSPDVAVGTRIPGVKVHGSADLNPIVVGAGIRYRFSL